MSAPLTLDNTRLPLVSEEALMSPIAALFIANTIPLTLLTFIKLLQNRL